MFKFIAITILITGLSSHSATFNIKRYNQENNSAVIKSKQFVDKLEILLERPMNWCKVTPTKLIEHSRFNKKVKFIIDFNIKCDERRQREYLKALWMDYQIFLDDPDAYLLVNKEFNEKYPDFKLKWGIALNSYDYLAIIKKPEYGGTLHFSNKVIFFHLSINGNTIDNKLYRVDMDGNILNTIETNQVRPIFTDNARFIVEIDEQLLKNELDIDVIPVWHTKKKPVIVTEFNVY